MKTILLLAKVIQELKWQVFTFKEAEGRFKIEAEDCLHALKVLRQVGALNFKIIPWNSEDPDGIEKFLRKHKEHSLIPAPEKGVMFTKIDRNILKKVINSPTLLDQAIKKVGLYHTKPSFDEKLGKIFFKDKSCNIPPGNQFALCKVVFKQPFGTLIPENDIAFQIDLAHCKETKRTVYDAMLAVNKRIKRDFGISKFMEWRESHVKVQKELFEM